MFINNFDPVALEIFSLEIRWYSLSYIFGIILGWILAKKLFIQDIEVKNKFDDYLTYLILGIILGGRLGYIFIYNLSFYINNPLDIFKSSTDKSLDDINPCSINLANLSIINLEFFIFKIYIISIIKNVH